MFCLVRASSYRDDDGDQATKSIQVNAALSALVDAQRAQLLQPGAAGGILAELFGGFRYLRYVPDSARLAIISYRCTHSANAAFTLDEHAFRSAVASAPCTPRRRCGPSARGGRAEDRAP